ncbi:MAG: DUF421 domain-containing protein [Tepidiformaceae bacterium]
MDGLLFNGWENLLRTVVIGVLAYAVLILFLRVSGKRTLSKMNAFDFVVTIALGSTLATILLNKDVALAEGAVAFAVLIGLQFMVTWFAVRFPWVRQAVTGEPGLLFHDGTFLHGAMRRARITDEEIFAAVRAAGAEGMDSVAAVVLETDGTFSVVRRARDDRPPV